MPRRIVTRWSLRVRQPLRYRHLLATSLLLVASLACGLTNTLNKLWQSAREIEPAPGLATAQALITEVGSGIPQTALAKVTELVVEPGDVPPDIPIWPGEKSGFVGSEQVFSYSASEDFAPVLEFYQREMRANGWREISRFSVTTPSSADLYYEKAGREVNIVINTLPLVDRVTVVISFLE